MKEVINQIENDFGYLKSTYPEPQLFDDTDISNRHTFSGFKGNANIDVKVADESEAEFILKLLQKDFTFLEEFVGIIIDKDFQIALRANGSSSNFHLRYQLEKITASMPYHNQMLEIAIENNTDCELFNLVKMMKPRVFKPTILTIKNFQKPSKEGLSFDLRNILNSILFDIEYTYSINIEPIELSELELRFPKIRKKRVEVPKEQIDLTFKKYIPELIQYYNLAEKVGYLPFKFLCYFHIAEYFSDKSVYSDLKKRIKHLIMKPDFHLNSDGYIVDIMNSMKGKNDQNFNDKIKLKKAFQEFIIRDEISKYLQDINMYDYFEKDTVIFTCVKPLQLLNIDFSDDTKFYDSLTSRIYSVRCSIVHSNPEFDEKKAVPFLHTPQNLQLLSMEIGLISEISRTIITKSAEFR